MECGDLLRFSSSYKTNLRATPLESTHMEMSASVYSKALTQTVSLLDATLMKNRGWVIAERYPFFFNGSLRTDN
jgi:hypothetical protein